MSDHFSAVVALDRKLLLTRFELAIEALLPIAPGLGSISFPSNPPTSALREWIETAERLVTTGVYERYPEHVRRHARALPAIITENATSDEKLEEVETRVRMFFGSEVLTEDVLDLGDGLRLRKTRRRDGENVEDWSALDALCTLKDSAVEQLCSVHPYRQAICAYRLGRFQECRDALVRCLDEDEDVREYWTLLAFTERHLGNFERFERIVFDEETERYWERRRPRMLTNESKTSEPGTREGPRSQGRASLMNASGIFAELIEARDSDLQLAQYAAVAAGLRRSLDDWISADRFTQFKSLAKRLGLVFEVDCIFESVSADSDVVGSQYAPTTRAAASPYRGLPTAPGSRLHIVVSSRSEWANEALASAWYSVVVNNRVLRKPLIDHFRFGRALGYPSCCVDFFLEHNDWARQNTLAEAARRTESFHWETNCLTKLTPWMLSFHMPCSFDCEQTIGYARSVLEAVRSWDAQFADDIVAFMRRPCLALSERFACALNDASEGSYSSVEDLCTNAPNRHPDDVSRIRKLSKGNHLKIEDATVFVYRDGSLVDSFEAKVDPNMIEVPLLLPFA